MANFVWMMLWSKTVWTYRCEISIHYYPLLQPIALNLSQLIGSIQNPSFKTG